jgi:hypothetical protein
VLEARFGLCVPSVNEGATGKAKLNCGNSLRALRQGREDGFGFVVLACRPEDIR